MSSIAETPDPPYYAVIFTSQRSGDDDGYAQMAKKMGGLASQQPGFLGMESVTQTLGITVSYWSDLDSIRQWKQNAEHRIAQALGRDKWYSGFKTRIARVERDYAM